MKKTTKILVTILMIMTIIMATTNVLAAPGTPVTPGQINGSTSNVDDSGMQKLGNDIVRILSTAGVIISVIILIVLGIKYMMGSAEEKAEYKKTLMPYIIGAALVFAASTIATVVFNFMSNVTV